MDLKDFSLVLGVIAFFWKAWDGFLSYLHMNVAVGKQVGKIVPVSVSLENKGSAGKRIDYAALVIGRPDFSPHEIVDQIVGVSASDYALNILGRKIVLIKKRVLGLHKLSLSHEFAPLKSEDRSALILPIPFFFKTQRQFGNEVVRTTVPLDVTMIDCVTPLTVTFAILVRYPLGLWRWRFTQDLVLASAPGEE